MFDYTEIAGIANEILAEFGQTVTLTHTVPGVYDPATGQVTTTATTQTGTGAVFEYDTKQSGIYNAPGSLVKVGDKQLVLSPLNAAGVPLTIPAVGDTVTIGATTYTITQVKATSPGGTVVMFDCNLRGA